MEYSFSQGNQRAEHSPNKVSFGQTILFLVLFCAVLSGCIIGLQFIINALIAHMGGGFLAISLAVVVGVIGYCVSVLGSIRVSSWTSSKVFSFINWITPN